MSTALGQYNAAGQSCLCRCEWEGAPQFSSPASSPVPESSCPTLDFVSEFITTTIPEYANSVCNSTEYLLNRCVVEAHDFYKEVQVTFTKTVPEYTQWMGTKIKTSFQEAKATLEKVYSDMLPLVIEEALEKVMKMSTEELVGNFIVAPFKFVHQGFKFAHESAYSFMEDVNAWGGGNCPDSCNNYSSYFSNHSTSLLYQ